MITLRIYMFGSSLDFVLTVQEAIDKAMALESCNYHKYDFILEEV